MAYSRRRRSRRVSRLVKRRSNSRRVSRRVSRRASRHSRRVKRRSNSRRVKRRSNSRRVRKRSLAALGAAALGATALGATALNARASRSREAERAAREQRVKAAAERFLSNEDEAMIMSGKTLKDKERLLDEVWRRHRHRQLVLNELWKEEQEWRKNTYEVQKRRCLFSCLVANYINDHMLDPESYEYIKNARAAAKDEEETRRRRAGHSLQDRSVELYVDIHSLVGPSGYIAKAVEAAKKDRECSEYTKTQLKNYYEQLEKKVTEDAQKEESAMRTP